MSGNSNINQPKKGGIRTLADMNNDSSSSGPSDGVSSYAGGISSGLNVQQPGTRPAGLEANRAAVEDLLRQARERGAQDYSQSRGGEPFRGTGQRLGDLAGPPLREKSRGESEEAEEEVVINLWENGFSIDDGELRPFDDPQNKAFLDEIGRGNVPLELVRARQKEGRVGQFVVHLKQQGRVYEAPPKVFKAFEGHGRSMKSGSSSSSTSSSSAAAGSMDDSGASNSPFVLDEGKEVTTLQLRLADGTRLVAKFNTDHTVGDIRRFINASRPGSSSRYTLMTTMPRATFTDTNQTIAAAGLKNAVLVQHMD
eukprot:NODE_3058_length_1059_cov_8.716832_g2806_i0.p1 GENE.NODE_3058_length_1059_cov_8.716832_g2806_i0~~NODE_3058_length_1059_cov_8.716832_g2806_i0.p1  ORF type:complete len:311 (-),score=54.41 NODE_3058_length_1059_cov_8.716832_g2806_i0:89-1021(-)